jgi:myo-inositol catabolism protein IolS
MPTELALGTWAFAGNFGFWSDQERSDSLKTLHYAIRNGITSFDTAASYGNGKAEQMLGQQLKRFPLKRSDLFIATKTMGNDSLETSLHRLCMEYVDLWYLHWPSHSKDCKQILSQMASEKKAKDIGICNADVPFLKTLRDLPIRYVQIPCSLLWVRGMEEMKAYCKERSIKLVGYSPTGMGILSGTHDDPPEDSRATLYCYQHKTELSSLLDTLKEIARNHQTIPSVIALSWALSQGFDQIILGARKKGQLEEDLNAKDIRLNDGEQTELNSMANRLSACADPKQDNLFGHRW